MKSKGFTIIELLVVISIIALLSSVVLTSIDKARKRGADNGVKVAMKQFATQAENYRDTAPTFGLGVSITPIAGAVCSGAGTVFSDSRIQLIQTNILSNASAGATFSCTTNATGNLWSLKVSELQGGGSICIDNSTGFKISATNVGGVCQ